MLHKMPELTDVAHGTGRLVPHNHFCYPTTQVQGMPNSPTIQLHHGETARHTYPNGLAPARVLQYSPVAATSPHLRPPTSLTRSQQMSTPWRQRLQDESSAGRMPGSFSAARAARRLATQRHSAPAWGVPGRSSVLALMQQREGEGARRPLGLVLTPRRSRFAEEVGRSGDSEKQRVYRHGPVRPLRDYERDGGDETMLDVDGGFAGGGNDPGKGPGTGNSEIEELVKYFDELLAGKAGCAR